VNRGDTGSRNAYRRIAVLVWVERFPHAKGNASTSTCLGPCLALSDWNNLTRRPKPLVRESNCHSVRIINRATTPRMRPGPFAKEELITQQAHIRVCAQIATSGPQGYGECDVDVNKGNISASVTYRYAKDCLMLDRSEGRCSLASSCGRKQGKGLAGISRQVSTGSGKVSADSWRCHGLAPWSLTPAATKAHPPPLFQMPRPCAVESHARRYKNKAPQNFLRCHGLAPWSLTLAAPKAPTLHSCRCHGLAPWSLTLAATKKPAQLSPRCHGLVPWSLTLAATKGPTLHSSRMPRPWAVESHARG